MKKSLIGLAASVLLPTLTWAQSDGCNSLPSYAELKTALTTAVNTESTGFNLNMWATIVDRDGIVCAVAFSGADRGSQWPGSRVISAQKANTANSFSLNGLALSTANLYSAVQPGGSLFGLQESNPVSTAVAYKGPSSNFGKANDPMTGEKIGGVNVFGGGLGLYGFGRKVVGAVGVSGDSSCEDHRVAWIVRSLLNLDLLPTGVGVAGDATHPDNMVFDIIPNPNGGTGRSVGGWGHAHCISQVQDGDPGSLPVVR
jgi:uncharacterized protein GlcG (DUF336 family)